MLVCVWVPGVCMFECVGPGRVCVSVCVCVCVFVCVCGSRVCAFLSVWD